MLSPSEETLRRAVTHLSSGQSDRETIHAQVLLHSNDDRQREKQKIRDQADWLQVSTATVNGVRKA